MKKQFEDSKDPAIRYLREATKSAKTNPKVNPYAIKELMKQSVLTEDTQNLGGEEE